MTDDVAHVGEGVLRREGGGYRGELTVLGIYVELVGVVAEDERGRHFKLTALYTRLPEHLRVPLLDDPFALPPADA